MLIGQLPRVLGIVGPSSPGVLEMGSHVMSQLSNILSFFFILFFFFFF